MSEALSKFIQKFEDKKYYDVCLLSTYLLAWLIVAYIGISELISLFSNNRLGLLEALLFTQIDLLSFQRSGIEIVSNGSWRSISRDTLLSDFRYWYNAIYIALWLFSFRLLLSEKITSIIVNINFSSALSQPIEALKLKLKDTQTLMKNTKTEASPLKTKNDSVDRFFTETQWKQKEEPQDRTQEDLNIPKIFSDDATIKLKALYFRAYNLAVRLLVGIGTFLAGLGILKDILITIGMNGKSYLVPFFNGLNCTSKFSLLECYVAPYAIKDSLQSFYFNLGYYIDDNLLMIIILSAVATFFQLKIRQEFTQPRDKKD